MSSSTIYAFMVAISRMKLMSIAFMNIFQKIIHSEF